MCLGTLAWGCSIYDASLADTDASIVAPGPGAGGTHPGDGGGAGASGAEPTSSSSAGGSATVAGSGASGALPDAGGGGAGGNAGGGGTANAGGAAPLDGGSDRTEPIADVVVPPRLDALVEAPSGVDVAPEASCPSPAACALRPALLHRYSFNGTGTTVTDSIGTSNGNVVNAVLSGDGTVFLSGGMSDQYVNLPNGIVKQLTNATFEAWITWNGGGVWQRLFDFGSSDGAENVQGVAVTTFYLSPQSDMSGLLAGFKRSDQTSSAEFHATAAAPLPIGTPVHVAVVVDDTNNQMFVYRNGYLDSSGAFVDSLAVLNDINNWLGRSQYAGDLELGATFHEFRIYGAALSAASVAASFAAGPDASFLK